MPLGIANWEAMDIGSKLGIGRPLIAAAVSSLIALRSWRHKSLSTSGALAGLMLLTISLTAGPRFVFCLFIYLFLLLANVPLVKCSVQIFGAYLAD